MQISASLGDMPGIKQVSLIMATPANLELLSESGLVEGELEPRPNDIMLAVEASDQQSAAKLIEAAEHRLDDEQTSVSSGGGLIETPARSFAMALDRQPEANLALISCPGEHAASEAEKAIRLGLDVMIFSDNVEQSDEIRIKKLAEDAGRLVMGPDCGTAIVGGVPLGFANVVRPGGIGIVAASGTGLQQVACLIDDAGMGISHALGTGGRDLSAEVGGLSMKRAIGLLAADPETKVLLLVSKPPAPEVAQAVTELATATGKPVVINFLGAGTPSAGDNCHYASTLANAAEIAVSLAGGEWPAPGATALPQPPKFAPGQKFIRGLYSGGTFCYEAQLLLATLAEEIRSSTPLVKNMTLPDPWKSVGHTVIDLGDDTFTRGRPHPMIDHRLRNERLVQEANDPETAVILFDVVLGHGSHLDPAAEMVPALRGAQEAAKEGGREIAFVGFVCGTEADPQSLSRQQQLLRKSGVILARHNAEAVQWSAGLLGLEIGDDERSQA